MEGIAMTEAEQIKLMLQDEKILIAMRVAIKWKGFKIFCRSRSECRGCPYAIECSLDGTKKYVCSVASDETILFEISDVARELFIKEGIPF